MMAFRAPRVLERRKGPTAGANDSPLSEKCQSVQVALLSADAGTLMKP